MRQRERGWWSSKRTEQIKPTRPRDESRTIIENILQICVKLSCLISRERRPGGGSNPPCPVPTLSTEDPRETARVKKEICIPYEIVSMMREEQPQCLFSIVGNQFYDCIPAPRLPLP